MSKPSVFSKLSKPIISLVIGLVLVVFSTLTADQNSGLPIFLAGAGLCGLFISVYLFILYTVGGGEHNVSGGVRDERK